MQTTVNLSIPFNSLLEAIQSLSLDEKKSLVDLIEAQIDQEEDPTTELLNIQGFTELLAIGEADIQNNNALDWRLIKPNV